MLDVALQTPTDRARQHEIGEGRSREREWKEPGSDAWLAIIAHELRSPLATIVTALEVASHCGDDSSVRQQAMHIAGRQALKSLQMIDDLFNSCAGLHSNMRLRKELVDLREIAFRAIETTHHLFEARQHLLVVQLPSTSLPVHADPLWLEQVLINLLSNSAKYCEPTGRICLAANLEDERVVLRVSDNGPGIASEYLPRIFDLFTRAPGLPTACNGGLGLGLAIVKSIVEFHGGSVLVASDGPGRGSSFTISLPHTPPQEELSLRLSPDHDVAVSPLVCSCE